MQGSGHLLEDFEQPSFLCPVCLHKMHALFHFDVEKRYNALAAFCEEHRLTEDAAEARRLQRAVAGSDGAAAGGAAGRAGRRRPWAAGLWAPHSPPSSSHRSSRSSLGSASTALKSAAVSSVGKRVCGTRSLG